MVLRFLGLSELQLRVQPLSQLYISPQYILDFNEIIGSVAGMQEEPDAFDKVIDPGFLRWSSHVHHPFMSGRVAILTVLRRDVSESKKENIGVCVGGVLWPRVQGSISWFCLL